MIMKTLKVNYPTKIEQIKLNEKLFILEVIRDLDEAIDLLCDNLSEEEQRDPFAEDLCPYFGILWPAAEALAQFLSEHQDLVQNKSILELGCGLGLPSLVASHLGGRVLATDYHPEVEHYFSRNCRHSVIHCDYQRLNWREEQSQLGPFDIVMGSDILYEGKHPQEVARGLIRFLGPKGKILLSDPGRSYLQQFINAMKAEGYQAQLIPKSVKQKDIYVFSFSKSTECIG
jgi:predicted nicotinamide N-methyase